MSRSRPSAVQRAIEAHSDSRGRATAVARAPGRVNLIGEHTDYNDGFVMPMALPFDTAIAVSPANGSRIEIESEGFGAASIALDGSAPLARTGGDDWSVHLRGVHRLLGDEGVVAPAFRATIASDVPAGASLSSSASIEVAFASAILHLTGQSRTPLQIAQLGQRVENEVLGLPSGIMDQLISASAVDGAASLIDCRTLESVPHAMPAHLAVVVMDTTTRRQLVDSEYAARRADCERAAAAIGVASLRDATEADVAAIATDDASLLRRRAGHVVSENKRTLAFADAMDAGDGALMGHRMVESHLSLRDDYEVSGPGLDQIVDAALASPGCLGARMTGGGFAGCAVALVELDRIDEFEPALLRAYEAASGLRAVTWVCRPSAGASVEILSD